LVIWSLIGDLSIDPINDQMTKLKDAEYV